jgi:hypothetical protein
MTDANEQSIPSRGSQPFAWAADIPGKFGAAPTVLFGYTEKLVKSIAAAGGDLVQPFPLYRYPTLTDEERTAIGWAIMECESMPTTLSREAADTLRSLLDRLDHGAAPENP